MSQEGIEYRTPEEGVEYVNARMLQPWAQPLERLRYKRDRMGDPLSQAEREQIRELGAQEKAWEATWAAEHRDTNVPTGRRSRFDFYDQAYGRGGLSSEIYHAEREAGPLYDRDGRLVSAHARDLAGRALPAIARRRADLLAERPSYSRVGQAAIDEEFADLEYMALYYQRMAAGEDVARTMPGRLEHQRMLATANAVAKSLGEKVVLYEAPGDIEDSDDGRRLRKQRSYGWYNPNDGTIHINVGRHRNAREIVQTVLHEIVGHKTIEQIMGPERFSRLIDEIWNHADKKVRAKIAQKMHKNGWDFREATKEYLGEIAEEIHEKGFEKLEAEKKSVWQRLRAKVQDFLNRILEGLKIPARIRLSERDLSYMMWKLYKHKQRKAAGKPAEGDIFDKAEDMVRREEMKRDKRSFEIAARSEEGDQIKNDTNEAALKHLEPVDVNHSAKVVEKIETAKAGLTKGKLEGPATFQERQTIAAANRGTVMPGLDKAQVSIVDVPKHDFTGTGKEALKSGEEWAKANIVGRHIAKNYASQEFDYIISGSSIGKYLSSSSIRNSENLGVHLSALKKLPEIISNSIEVEEHADYSKDEKGIRSAKNRVNDETLIHRYFGAISIDGNTYRVKTTIREFADKNRCANAHNYEVTKIELIDAPAHGVENSMNPVAMSSVSSISAAKLLKDVEKSYDPGKKILDESRKNESLHFRDGETDDIWKDPKSKVMGKNRFSKKRQAEFATRERQRMVDRIQELAGRMHLSNVEIVTDVTQLEGKRANSKGFFNKRTGKISIVIPNNISTIDAEQTLLHEAVAHYGLRQLFGEHFDTFLDNVYQSADESIRRKIAEMAAKKGWDFRTATEEYLAGLAEDTNFNEAQSYPGLWSKIKRLFLDMLERIGFKGFRDKVGVVLTDNELRYILWRSYENLSEPGRYRSILGEAADVVKQSKLKVGNYAETGIEAEYVAEGNGEIDEISMKFNQELDAYAKGQLASGHRFELGMPSRYLRSAGFPNLPISMRSSLLARKAGDEKHPFEASDIKGLVDAIQKPIAIFEYTKSNMRNLIVDVTRGNKHFLVGVTLNYKSGEVEINSVSGLFPKESHEWVKWIQDGKAIRIDKKEKVQAIIDSLRTNPAESERIGLNLEGAAKIVNSFENPTLEEEELYRPGDFSPRDRVIARDTYNRVCASGTYQFKEAVQDSMLGLKELYKAIEPGKRIEDISGFENAYLFENRMSSMNAGEQHEYFRRYMLPLLIEIGRIAGANERKRKELTDYIMAKHGLERNAYMRNEAAANGEDTDRDFAGLIGLTGEADWSSAEATAQQWVDDYEAMHNTAPLWDAINSATKATLEKVYLSGIISKETYEKILGMYNYYVPLRGWNETTSEQVYGYLTSKNGPLSGSIMKKAEGRESMADDPIATIAMMADDAIRQGNRNLMKQRLLNFVLNHPSDAVSVHDMWLRYDDITDEWEPVFADVEPTDTAEDVAQKIEDFEQRMEALRSAEPNRYKKGRETQHIPYKVVRGNLREHQILIKRNGRTFVATINGNPRAAQAINGLSNPDVDQNGVVGNMLKAGTWVNRQLSAFYTTRNPDFVVGNFFRDMLYSNCMTWVKESPRYALRFHKNFARFTPISPTRFVTNRFNKGLLDYEVFMVVGKRDGASWWVWANSSRN